MRSNEAMRTLARSTPLILSLLVLGGCALPVVPPDQSFTLSADAPIAPIVRVVDARPAEEHGPMAYEYGQRVDEKMLSPAPADYVAQQITRAVQSSPDRARIEPWLAGKTLMLRHFEIVAVRKGMRPRYRTPAGQAEALTLPGAPYPRADVALAGDVATSAIADTLSALGAAGSEMWADIDVELDGTTYVSHNTCTTNVVPFSSAPVKASAQSVGDLVDRIVAAASAPASR